MKLHGQLSWCGSLQEFNYMAHVECSYANPLAEDGGFSRVVPLSMHNVIKVTTCGPTQHLYSRLDQAGSPIPGLPQVVQMLGIVAEDQEGFKYSGYVLERLYPRQLSSTPAGVYPLDENWEKVDFLVKLIQETYVFLGVEGQLFNKQVDILLCKILSQLNPYKTGKAFEFLAEVLKTEGCSLDLLTPGNILLNKDGDVVLADPVAYMGEIEPAI